MVAERALTFPKGGIHPDDNKALTAGMPVEILPPPKEVRLLLKQHAGAPCEPLVKKKDRVTEGDLIGSMGDRVGANLHASVSGTVKRLGRIMHPAGGKVPAIVIATDMEAGPKSYASHDWTSLSRDRILARIRDAGVVGLGGAGFPAAVKLALKPDARVDTLILNGAECEPYLTSDHRIMLEHAPEVVTGAKIILSVLGIRNCVGCGRRFSGWIQGLGPAPEGEVSPGGRRPNHAKHHRQGEAFRGAVFRHRRDCPKRVHGQGDL
jgi:electron transport complex protein RnfC